LLPRAEIEFAFGDDHNDFAARDLTLEMRAPIIFAGAIVPTGVCPRVRRSKRSLLSFFKVERDCFYCDRVMSGRRFD